MANTPKPKQAIITSRYWLVLSAVAGVVGYGAAIWMFFLSVPTGGIIFAAGALAAVAIEWISGLKRNRSR